ncbi:MAG: tandem-95 repeat protein, partial [candidate division Zixibacteria bacterium]|nr:tandem-95 repeat protein [candidate division Zixibacteria bacterium]
NGNGTGTFNWTPAYTQSGSYNITFFASDGFSLDSEIVAITVIEAGNQAPFLAAIGPKSVYEARNLNFGVTAADPDGTFPTLTTSILPGGATFVDNHNGTGTFNWTPNNAQAASYFVTFYASDGSIIDSEAIVITVLNANQPPVLAAIGPRSVNENANLNFGVSAVDGDGTIPVLTTSALPAGAGFVNNGNGTGTFNWTPTFYQSGVYNVTFYVTDDSLGVDSEIVAITVNNINQAPILAAIGARIVDENSNLNFSASATDPDGNIPVLTVSTLPTGATFIDNANGTGTFDWTPTFDQSGLYYVTFYASDGVAIDSEAVTITVNNVNRPPVLAAIGAKAVGEGINLNFNVTSTDPDGNIPALTVLTLPTGATFVDHANGSGTFDWTPTFDQAGTYSVTFYSSDGVAIDSEVVSITVGGVNQAPILAAIGAKVVNENSNLNFGVSATDADGNIPALTVSTLPTGATFVDNANGTGTFNWTPTFYQAGTYNVTLYASDGIATDSEVVTITVNNVNQPPILAAIGAKTINENSNLNFGVSASDLDGNIPALTVSTLPTGATFADNANGTGTFNWTPTFYQSGIFSVTFYASDGVVIDSEVVTITVNNVNQPPILAAIGAKAVDENTNLNFGISASDLDGNIPALTVSTLPTGATFVDNANGSGTFDWTPTFDQSGIYNVTFYASDGVAIDSEIVSITVGGVNQAPILAAIGAKTANENSNLNFGVTAADADGNIPALTVSTLPTGATFVDHADGSGTFNWTPTFYQAGSYSVTFYASDGVAIDSEIVTITVNNVNQAPILAAIGAKTINENSNLNFGVSASDLDGNIPALTVSTLPTGATFIDHANGTGTFDWTPTFYQAGFYNVTFYSSDGSATDSEVVTITVNNVNQSPILAAIGAKAVDENNNLNFGVSASDLDGNIPTLTVSTLPTGATFIDNTNGTGTFNWTPTFDQAGIYSVTFYASDGVTIDSEVVSITVGGINQPPVLAAIGAKAVEENSNLNFGVSTTDADGNIPALTVSTLPSGATFSDHADGTGTFDWTPTFDQSGVYNVTFYASDGIAIDSEIVTVTVNDVNRAPIANAGPDQPNGIVGATAILDGTGSYDPDGTGLIYSWTQVSGPAATLSDPAVSSPTFVPSFPGVYSFALTVTDGTLFSAPDNVVITAANAAPPQAISDLSIAIVADNILLSWSAVTRDTDGLNTQIGGYIIYRDTIAYFTPSTADSIGATDPLTLTFTDNNLGGANVVGDTLQQYFYAVISYDIYGNRSAASNRVGEYDYQIVTTLTTNYNLICIPFENTGITTADQLINAIGRSSVRTVNNYRPSSQSFEQRFAAGFGVNFSVVPGGIYQVNASGATIFSVAGRVPAPGAITYQLVSTATTDYSFLSVPFEREANFRYAQDVLNNVPGGFNTLNNFVAGSQSYQSRFAAGFGVNFRVKAGRPYQANSARNDTFPKP